jgi:hypothetical protein
MPRLTRARRSDRFAHALALTTLALLLPGCQDDEGGDSPTEPSANNAAVYAACGNQPNYAGSVTLLRWRSFPLLVFLDVESAPRSHEPAFRQAFERGMRTGAEAWAVAGGGIGTVSYVSSAAAADITVRFVPGLGSLLGRVTHTGNDGRYITRALVELDGNGFLNLTNGGPSFVERATAATTGHEMGHALFAAGHSPFAGDLLGPPAGNFPAVRATERDINTIREAYCRP